MFEIAGYVINFKDMTETVNGQVREIRRADDSHIRLRRENERRAQAVMSSGKRGKRLNFDKTSFRWLEQNYVRIKGLRNWTWKTIV